ncbi:YceI family protein [Haliangium sp.]|uniref:YceI family protein n=1 Tax=Haliangium sp. TaxID=2663208 RepID=UPI003D0CDDB2
MATYDASQAECLVYTFKEGLLSKIAHDLKIRVNRFSVDIDDDSRAVSASFDARSLQVECVMKDGVEAPGTLSHGDKHKIEGQIIDDVLHAGRFPDIRFTSTEVKERGDGGFDLVGDLTLHGTVKPVRVSTRLVQGRQVVEVVLHQPDYGIKPFRAMMGALKVQADVKVALSVPA